MLLAGDDPGDRARALELIGEALATYRELGMNSWVEKTSEHERAATRRSPAQASQSRGRQTGRNA